MSDDNQLEKYDKENLPAKVEQDEEDEGFDDLSKKSEMPFLDHLEEMRIRILWGLGALFVGMIAGIAIAYYFDALEVLKKPVEPYLTDGMLTIIKPTEGFMITLKIGFGIGLIMALPVILYQFWAFVAPALRKNERRLVFPLIFASIFMFTIGSVMAYYITLPLGMAFFAKFQTSSTQFMITASSYLDIAIKMILMTGVVFQLPIIIMLLARLGIVSPKFLREKRRHAIVAMFIVAMAVTPADPGSMILVAVPLVFLYELSVWIAVIMARKKKEKELEEEKRLEELD